MNETEFIQIVAFLMSIFLSNIASVVGAGIIATMITTIVVGSFMTFL